MSQTGPSWNIYQNAINNFKGKYDTLPRQIRILISIFIYQLTLERDPEDFPNIFACHDEDACSFIIGDSRIIFRPERIDQGTQVLRVLHLIDLITE